MKKDCTCDNFSLQKRVITSFRSMTPIERNDRKKMLKGLEFITDNFE